MTVHFRFDISYARLPDRFFARLPPTPVSAPKLVKLNRQLAADLDLDAEWLASPEGVEVPTRDDVLGCNQAARMRR
jgi:serine/tyrosine/threonine adenylyltransferase